MNPPFFANALIVLIAASHVAPPQAMGGAKRAAIHDVVQRAFLAVHDGWSSDEVLLQDELNKKFIAHCRRELPNETDEALNWTLLNLRKAGKLKIEITKRRRDKHDQYQHLAEIAARTLQDKHQVSTDRVMCNAELRGEFDEQVRLLSKDADPYLMRKAAFGLRKNRRLKPELVLRIADWGREIVVHKADELADDTSVIPEMPGIYIFRDITGYLYVGESLNLRERLKKHLEDSDRKSLANYLRASGTRDISIEIHVFPKDSRAKEVSVRRAYESALIASRKPRFNLRP